MTAPRRYLPSISALMAFEAVARCGSATEAAAELDLTQSAVSRQIKSLEDRLGVALFRRRGRNLLPTPDALRYLTEVRTVLDTLSRASVALRTKTGDGPLELAILPAFGMHWLAPRLRDFAVKHPEVTVNLSTRLAPFEFDTNRFHAAIHFGHEDWAGAHHMPLLPEIVVPVCAPSLMPTPSNDPQSLLAYDLLHLETRLRGWARWFRAVGVETAVPRGMVFDQFSTMAQAAIHGLGIALLPTFCAAPYLESGQLVRASPRQSESIGNYYLVWPKGRPDTQALSAFRTWIAGEATGY